MESKINELSALLGKDGLCKCARGEECALGKGKDSPRCRNYEVAQQVENLRSCYAMENIRVEYVPPLSFMYLVGDVDLAGSEDQLQNEDVEKICENCEWFFISVWDAFQAGKYGDNPTDIDVGGCKRHAPKGDGWPRVGKGNNCGDFSPAPSETKEKSSG